MIPATLQALWMLLVAYMEARTDAATIGANKPIIHRSEWQERAVAAVFGVAVLAFLCEGIRALLGYHIPFHYATMIPGLLLLSIGVFSASFRYMLNKRRGKDWTYLSPSNHYDWFFLWRSGKCNRKARAEILASWAKDYNMDCSPGLEYFARAGHMAYAFELSLLIAGGIICYQ